MVDPACAFLPWDSSFFGVRIARIEDRRITADSVERVLAWCASEDIECIYLLADLSDRETARLAAEHGFVFVDVRVTLRRGSARCAAEDTGRAFALRDVIESDLAELLPIARTGFHESRFYFDGNFPRGLCDLLYETWLEKSCHGWADNVIVAERSGVPSGFITCHLDDVTRGRIGLVGVADSARGLGLGGGLVHSAVAWLAQRGADTVSVVTQGRNTRAIRLYERSGFAVESLDLWYHKWFRGDVRRATA